jgi:hypothetical protein
MYLLDILQQNPTKYLSKINLTFLEKRKISVFLISCSLFPVPSPKYKIYFARLLITNKFRVRQELSS